MLKIETGINNKILRTISNKIKDQDINKYIKLWNKMLKYIKNPDNLWIGLAAPQVWYAIRLIVVGLPDNWDDENFKFLVMVNPYILEFSEEKICDEEWCLSVPWKKWQVERSVNIKLAFQDKKGIVKTLALEGLRARIVQHEIDHLDWILFVDKLDRSS